jgi:hypothetical protein
LPNPFNPLDWVKSAQDWFIKAEKSSGFRPYLVFLLLCFGTGVVLLMISTQRPKVEDFALILIGFPVVFFIPLYFWKAMSQPDFCRSETHVERIKKIELEAMGNDSFQIPGDVYEDEVNSTSIAEPLSIETDSKAGGAA